MTSNEFFHGGWIDQLRWLLNLPPRRIRVNGLRKGDAFVLNDDTCLFFVSQVTPFLFMVAEYLLAKPEEVKLIYGRELHYVKKVRFRVRKT